jgi:polar amino acid transport system ATP-binding protein/sulfate transport system ATP-binding protein
VNRDDAVTGQVIGLLGPSGIGKTTLFRVLAGIERPDRGRVRINASGDEVEVGMVGVVAQHYPLFAHRSVLGNLVVAGRQAGLDASAAREKARGYLREFDLAGLEERFPCQLSGGQRQRVAILQQFLCSRYFLLMDEPFSGLDPLAVERACELITRVANAHTLNTIIVVSHHIGATIQVADHICLLGRDRDAEGRAVPGARVQKTFDLVERGLAWRKGIASSPEYLQLYGEIREAFDRL